MQEKMRNILLKWCNAYQKTINDYPSAKSLVKDYFLAAYQLTVGDRFFDEQGEDTCANCRRWKVDAKDAKDRNIFLKAVEDGRIKGSTYLKLEGECTGLRMHVLPECKLVVIENLKLKSDNCEWRLKTTGSFVCSEWAEKLTDEDIQRADMQKITFTSHDAMLKAFGIMTQLAPRGVMLCPACHGYGATVEFDKNDGHLIRQSCSCGYDSSKVTDGKVFAPMGKEDQ